MDQWILQWSNQQIVHPVLDVFMVVCTTLGLALIPLIGIALMQPRLAEGKLGRVLGPHLGEQHHRQNLGRVILYACLASLLLTLLFYGLAMRPRPESTRLLLPAVPFPSFPSGHTTIAFGAATAVWLTLKGQRNRLSSAQKGQVTILNLQINPFLEEIILFLGLFGTASIIAFSRIYLGHHYPSDIIAGVILGLATGATVYGFSGEEKQFTQRLRWLLWPQVALAILVTQMAYMDILPLHLLRWPYADKVMHFLLFGLIVFWLNLWLNGRTVKLFNIALPIAVIVPLTLATIEEGFQHFSPYRTLDMLDLLCDVTGMLFFWWLSAKLLQE
ncbi:MAG: phosphatase PAP2 family protein [Chloroflexota bacterium]